MTDDLSLQVSDDLLFGFLDESLESLNEIDALLVQLESAAEGSDVVNSIFRPIHSIKGNAPFFGFTKVRTLAHEMESLLALVREGKRKASKSMVSVLLEGVDTLRSMLTRVHQHEPEVTDEPGFQDLVARVVACQKDGSQSSAGQWDEAFALLARITEGSDEVARAELAKLRGLLESIAPHDTTSAKPAAGGPLAGLRELIEKLAANPTEATLHESLLADLNTLKGQAPPDALAEVTKLLDDVPPYLGSIGFDDLLKGMLTESIDRLEGMWPKTTTAAPPPPPPSASLPSSRDGESAPAREVKTESHKSMRVSEEHIDTFLAYVGELFIFGEMLSSLERRVIASNAQKEIAFEFSRLSQSFTRLSQNLQKSLMSIRKVSVRSLLQKVPRLVRDIATSHQKEIRVLTTGEDVEVDKSLIDLIDAPLTHMVRNAADHGVELPDQRASAGKDREGVISVEIREEEKQIVLTVKDDGGGLRYDKLQRKAEELGIVSPGQTLNQNQVVDLLFQAGVSTAEKVTDVSGRGVGMDVVKRTVESAGGGITVTSEAGKGTTFTVNLVKSVTTQIVESLIFVSNGRHYVVPTDRVTEVFACDPTKIFSAAGRDRFITRNDRALPVVPACNILSTKSESVAPFQGRQVISVKANRRELALLVDEVLAVQQVVLKKIPSLAVRGDVYTGGVLIGDGDIALVLDLDRFCTGYDKANVSGRFAIDRAAHGDRGAESAEGEGGQEETLLIASLPGGRQVAIPLEEVSRLERFEANALESSAGRCVIQYRDEIMPVVSLLPSAGGPIASEELCIVVVEGADRHCGILVDDFLDIVRDRIVREPIADSTGLFLASAIIKGKVTDILSVPSALARA